MLTPSALRFLAFLPGHVGDPLHLGCDAAKTVADLTESIARHDPDLGPLRNVAGCLLWTSMRPVDIPILVSADGRSCSVGWIFDDTRRASSSGRWGGFVTLAQDPQGRWSAYRSADGVMTACAISIRTGVIVASHVPAWLLNAVGIVPEIDWNVIAAVLGNPTITGHQSALRGVVMIPPGCRLDVDVSDGEVADTHSARHLRLKTTWDPCETARAACAMPVAVAEERLREAVDEVASAWGGVSDHMLLELSGGLDSSILAGTLGNLVPDRRITLVNASTIQAGGDERRYARDVAELCKRQLVEIDADRRVLDVGGLCDLVHPCEPILYGLDAGHDMQVTAHAHAVGADAIFTGQGGDAIFYQMPDLTIAVDAFRLWGWRAVFSTHTRDITRRAQRSVWSAWSLMLADRFGRASPSERFPSPMATPAAAEHAGTYVHPWLTGLRGLPPAKARQVEAIAHSQIFYGPTLRAQSTLFVHPFLSKPVVEACLSIPIPILTGGRGDRQRARAAFADRLPTSVAQRHSKGEAASHYSLAVTNAVTDLRSLLLEGRLVAHGLLDRTALDKALNANTLLWNDVARPLMLYASIEAWIRYWERA